MSVAPSRPVADSDYLLLRAEAEAKAAEMARSDASAEAHHRLASGYLDVLFGTDGAAMPPRSALAGHQESSARRDALLSPFMLLEPVGSASDFDDLLTRLT
jgi:hypothetical protein